MEHQNERCIRCLSNNINYATKQIRHDEMPKIYFRCLTCQYAWKTDLERPSE